MLLETRGFPAGHPFHNVRAMPADVPLPPIFLLGSSDYSARSSPARSARRFPSRTTSPLSTPQKPCGSTATISALGLARHALRDPGDARGLRRQRRGSRAAWRQRSISISCAAPRANICRSPRRKRRRLMTTRRSTAPASRRTAPAWRSARPPPCMARLEPLIASDPSRRADGHHDDFRSRRAQAFLRIAGAGLRLANSLAGSPAAALVLKPRRFQYRKGGLLWVSSSRSPPPTSIARRLSRRPAGAPKGGMVVVQEIFGVNHHIRAVCDRLAALGYVAVAPAVFDRFVRNFESGYTPDEIAHARSYLGNLNWDHMMADIAAAKDDLKGVGPLGVVGFCMGGTAAFLAACRRARPFGGGRLLRRHDRQVRRRETEVPDADAFRREGRRHSDGRGRDHQAEAAAGGDLYLSRMRRTASIATSARATARKPATSPGSARRSFWQAHEEIDSAPVVRSCPRKRESRHCCTGSPLRADERRMALEPPLLDEDGVAGAHRIFERHFARICWPPALRVSSTVLLKARGAKPPAIATAVSTVMLAT